MLLFAGSSNLPLAQKIADELRLELAKSETVRFADGEARVRILEEVKDEVCVVVQSTSSPVDSNLMELYQFGDLLKKGKAKKIVAVVPYLAYSRQDKAHRQGEAVTAKLVAKMIKAVGFTDIILLELHSQDVVNFFTIPTLCLSATETVAKYIDEKRDDFGEDDLVIVAPDEGGKQRAENLAQILEATVAVIAKDRPLEKTDVVQETNMTVKSGTVKDKEAIVVDDLISTGSTAMNAANLVLKQGAYHAYLIAIHAVMSKGDTTFWQNSPFEKIFVTDSINMEKNKQFEKLTIISVASLIAKNLTNLV